MKRLKTLLLAGTIAGISTAALAADIAPAAAQTKSTTAAVPYSWTGLYVGANVGYGFGDFNATGLSSLSDSGFLGGVQLGYNHQVGSNLVVGLESDFDGSTQNAKIGGATFSMPWFGTTRVRAGYLVMPSLLAYATGGVAYGHADITAGPLSVTVPGVGWTVGGGVEYMIYNTNWSTKLEYLYVDLGGPSASAFGHSFNTSATNNIIRVGANYRF